MSNRRARGHYSPLICKRCRARKIKCILPDSLTAPSDVPQPLNLACQRCRQNGFDCLVEQTVLGRPGASQPLNSRKTVPTSTAFIQNDEALELNTREFLLSQPYENNGRNEKRIEADEVTEALSSPLRFLSVLLSHHPDFGREMPSHDSWTGLVSLTQVISLAIQEVLESRLVWHRLYHPYIPALQSLRERLQFGHAGHSSIALYALLWLLANVTTSKSPPITSVDNKILECILHHYGQATLLKPPPHLDTVTFFQLLAEYRPLALVNSPIAAVSSLTDSSYLSLAIKAAQDIGLDHSWKFLDNENSLLETLQWLHLFTAQKYSSFIMGKSEIRQTWLDEVQPVIDKLHSLLISGIIPPSALLLTMHLFLGIRSANARHNMIRCWRDLDGLRSTVLSHHSACDAYRQTFMAINQWKDDDGTQVSVLTSLLDAELHKSHLLVKQSAMFFAVMAASYLREQAQFDPSEITQLGDHVVDHLKTPLDINQVHAFMAEFGAGTADELEKQLKHHINLCDLRLGDIAFAPPTKTFASEVLHTSYLLVQQNAARLKGWGGLHDRVDFHITIIRECANKLNIMADQEGGTGSICKPTASLVRDLGRILSDWKKQLAETSQFQESFNRHAESNTSSGPSTTSWSDSMIQTTTVSPPPNGQIDAIAAPRLPGSWAIDMFATWETWPQPEDIDFSEFIDFDYDPAAQDD